MALYDSKIDQKNFKQKETKVMMVAKTDSPGEFVAPKIYPVIQ